MSTTTTATTRETIDAASDADEIARVTTDAEINGSALDTTDAAADTDGSVRDSFDAEAVGNGRDTTDAEIDGSARDTIDPYADWHLHFDDETSQSRAFYHAAALWCYFLAILGSTAALTCATYSYASCNFYTRYVTVYDFRSTEDQIPNVDAACVAAGYNGTLQPLCNALFEEVGVGFRGFSVNDTCHS